MRALSGLLLAAGVALATVPPYSPITTKTCSAGSSANIMATLPRFDTRGQKVSSDLGSYSIASCPIENSKLNCSINNPFANGFKPDGLRDGSADGTILQYASGPVLYVVLCILMVILNGAFCTLFILGRYFCCCCNRRKCCCVTIQCGGHEPTPAMCGCGVKQTAPEADTWAYPLRSRVCAFLLMFTFLSLVSAFVIIGAVLGFQDFPEAAKKIAPAASSAIMPFVNSGITSFQGLAISMVSTVVAPTLVHLNTTLQSGLDLGKMDDSLGCIITSIDTVPNVDTILASADAFNASLVEVKATLGDLSTSVDGVVASKDSLVVAVNGLSGVVTGLSTSLASVNTAILAVNTSVTPLLTTKYQLLNESTPGSGVGYVTTLESDIGLLVPNAGMPNSTIINATAGPDDVTVHTVAEYGSLNRLIQGDMLGQVAEINALVDRLQSINGQVAGVLGPHNFSVTADVIVTLNGIAATMRTTTLPALSTSITAAQTALGTLPNSTTIMPYVNAIADVTDHIPFGGIVAALRRMQNVLNGLPSIPALIALLDQIKAVAAIVPCASVLTNEMRRVNATLVQLPDAINSILDAVDNINGTLNSALDQITTVQGTLRATQDQINSVNISTYIGQANDAWASVNASIATFNISSIQGRVAQLDTGIPVNFTALQDSLTSLNSTLQTATISNSIITTLRDFQTSKSDLISYLSRGISDYTMLAQGFCTNSPSTSCTAATAATACSGNPCTEASYRCKLNPATTCANGDSDCPAVNDYCLSDATRAGTLKGSLQALRDNALDTSVPLAQLASIRASAAAVDGASMQASIASAVASIAAVDTSSISAQLATVNGSLNSFDTANVQSTVANLRSSVDGVNFGQFRPQIADLNSTINNVKVDQRARVVGVRALLGAMRTILNVKLRDYVHTMSAPALRAALAANGTSGMLTSLINVGQDAYDTLAGVNQDVFPLSSMDLGKYVPADTIDKYMGDGPTSKTDRNHGLINFAAGLVMPDKVLPNTASGAGGVFKDADGNDYAGSKMCFTDACISATIEQYGQKETIHQFAKSVPLDITPLAFLNLIWLFPAVVVLCGFWGMMCPACCCRSKPQWQKCPTGCMTGCIMVQLPVCFLLAALLFPMSMVLSDVCASGRNVGYKVMLSTGDGICPLAYGTGGMTDCDISTSISLPSGDALRINANDVSFPGYVSALLGDRGAATCTGGASPWAGIVTDIAAQLETIPYTQAAYFISSPGNMLEKAGVSLRPAMTDVVFTATNTTGTVISGWLGDQVEAGGIASCAVLNGVVNDSLDMVCCTVVTPLYWLSSTFFLLAWFYCCCGLPAGIWGRKRIPTGVWGSLVPKVDATKPGAPAAGGAADGKGGRITGAAPAAAGGEGAGEIPAKIAVVGPTGTIHPNVTVRQHHIHPSRAAGPDPGAYYDAALDAGTPARGGSRGGVLAGAVPMPSAPGATIEMTATGATPRSVAASPMSGGMHPHMLPVVPGVAGAGGVPGRPVTGGAMTFVPVGVAGAGPRGPAGYAVPMPPHLVAAAPYNGMVASGPIAPPTIVQLTPGGGGGARPGGVDIDGARFK